jgi:hypothetical protein
MTAFAPVPTVTVKLDETPRKCIDQLNHPSRTNIVEPRHASVLKEKSPGGRAMLGKLVGAVVCDTPGLE